jgi:hypothetical protein
MRLISVKGPEIGMQKNESLLIGNRYTELNLALVEDNRFSVKFVRTSSLERVQKTQYNN